MRPLPLLAVVLCIVHIVCASSTRPNILFILADDLGYADVSYHNSDLFTPKIDALAAQGIKLENYYVHQVCTPARSSLLTGRYPCRYGLQAGALQAPQPAGLNLTEVTLADKMRAAGYATHAFGKWHLGFFDIKYTPTYRGFDSHLGYWNGEEDYKNHTEFWYFNGYDFRNNSDVLWLNIDDFSSTIFESETMKLLNAQAAAPPGTAKPFFIYLALQTPHAPLEPRTQDLLPCLSILDPQRKLFCGLVVNLDNTVGDIVSYLSASGLIDNTLVVFSNDNGGWNVEGGYNYPYRGSKFTNWEGGVKGVSFVYGAGVPQSKKGTTYKGLMHITDWLPTLMHVIGSDTNGTKPLDGVDQWNAITNTGISPRTEILHNMNTLNDSAIRSGDWKLIVGKQTYDGYFYPVQISPTKISVTSPVGVDNPLGNFTYLFNITADPWEQYNLAADHPDIVSTLQAKIYSYYLNSAPPVISSATVDLNSNPIYYNNTWSAWANTTGGYTGNNIVAPVKT